MGAVSEEFFKSLEIGKHYGERPILQLIKIKHPDAIALEGYNKKGDILLPSHGVLIEVKVDKRSLKSGRFVVEIANDLKNTGKFEGSGLNRTESKYWIFSDTVNVFSVLAADLKSFVMNLPIETWRGSLQNGQKENYPKKVKYVYLSDMLRLANKSFLNFPLT